MSSLGACYVDGRQCQEQGGPIWGSSAALCRGPFKLWHSGVRATQPESGLLHWPTAYCAILSRSQKFSELQLRLVEELEG